MGEFVSPKRRGQQSPDGETCTMHCPRGQSYGNKDSFIRCPEFVDGPGRALPFRGLGWAVVAVIGYLYV
jgi:hypothetical protein